MRFISWIKRDFFRVFPAFLFFFISLNLINMIEGLYLRSKGIPPFSFYTVFLAAAIIGKILVVIEHLPFINAFPRKALIFNILWKTFLYEMSCFIVRLFMRIIPPIIDSNNFALGYENFKSSFDSMQFISIQLIYLVLFFTFVTAQEFVLAIGPLKIRKMLFGK